MSNAFRHGETSVWRQPNIRPGCTARFGVRRRKAKPMDFAMEFEWYYKRARCPVCCVLPPPQWTLLMRASCNNRLWAWGWQHLFVFGQYKIGFILWTFFGWPTISFMQDCFWWCAPRGESINGDHLSLPATRADIGIEMQILPAHLLPVFVLFLHWDFAQSQ